MKTKFYFTAFLLSFAFILNAQLKVLSTGRVEMHNQTAIYSNENNPTDGIDIVGNNGSLSSTLDLIWGYYSAAQPNLARLMTLQSVDGAYFTVKASGRVGIFNAEPSCALEVGTAGQNEQIKVNGSIVLTSDERLKNNIKDLSNSLNKIKQLRTVTYNYKMPVLEVATKTKSSVITDSTKIHKPEFVPKADTSGRIHYGLLAQDVQKVFPDLVYKDSAGLFSVDYIGIIPLLVDALRDQQTQLDTQSKQIAYLTDLVTKSNTAPKKVNSSIAEVDALSLPVLEQNTPNPFNVATSIGYYLPATITTAGIYIYDMNGTQLKNYPITQKEKGNVVINGREFNAGMYLYALIVDGKVIDTKRMILTK
jgi:hypothetical protein